MQRILISAAAALMFSAQSSAPPQIVLRAARMITAAGESVNAPAVVVIRGERIVSIGGAVPAGARVIDLGAATLLPGLIDLHTHLTSTGVHWEDELLKTTPGQAALHGAHKPLITLTAGGTAPPAICPA